MGYTTGIKTEEQCREIWASLPFPVEGESFKLWRALYQLARRKDWTLPERQRGRPPLPRKRQRVTMTYDEWLEEWEALPVPIGYDNQSQYQRLRRIALNNGWDRPPRPNPGHENRERDFHGRLKPTY